eukprot:TRINITY_DN9261_c0_g1_i3.p1 TRINITY_DN9261_c0_g1~~TRINITY_DN9261_c0_g1_i3.p1  ORF type:complete len:139 (+),score=5.86 TRINITY_DN9261_c0_g1_i3:236-652(+)
MCHKASFIMIVRRSFSIRRESLAEYSLPLCLSVSEPIEPTCSPARAIIQTYREKSPPKLHGNFLVRGEPLNAASQREAEIFSSAMQRIQRLPRQQRVVLPRGQVLQIKISKPRHLRSNQLELGIRDPRFSKPEHFQLW